MAPEAEGENLLEKLELENSDRAFVLKKKGSLFNGQLEYRLLEGAPLMVTPYLQPPDFQLNIFQLNEIVFLHRPSSTLLVADAYYSGHCCPAGDTLKLSPPNPFTRIWFKMTKNHWASSQLPSYRTSRVINNGSPQQVVSCLTSIVSDWSPVRMVSAHGDTVLESRPGQELIRAWTSGVLQN